MAFPTPMEMAFTSPEFALHLSQGVTDGSIVRHDPRCRTQIYRGYCTNYNKPKTTLTRAEKVTILNHGICTNSACTYCIFSKSLQTNMRVPTTKKKVFCACFSMDAGAVRILLSSDKECTYVCFRGTENASPILI